MSNNTELKIGDFYRTPIAVFHWAQKAFGGTFVDACGNCDDALSSFYIGQGGEFEDFLDGWTADELFERAWGSDVTLFINPPYSNVSPFVQRAIDLKYAGVRSVMLLNADKSTKWFLQAAGHANQIVSVIGGRISFINPYNGQEAKANSKGQMFIVFDPNFDDCVSRHISIDTIRRVGRAGEVVDRRPLRSKGKFSER